MDSYAICRMAAVSALRLALARDPLRGLKNKGNLKSFITQVNADLREEGYRPETTVDLTGDQPQVRIVLKGPEGCGNYTAVINGEELAESMGLANVRRPELRPHRVDIGVGGGY